MTDTQPRPIKRYPGYTVDENAIVRNAKGRTIKPYMHRDRMEIHLYRDKKMYTEFLHILVYEAFYGERVYGMQIDHIDAIRTNNHYSNLRMVIPEINLENRPYMVHGEQVKTAKLTDELVLEIRASYPKRNTVELAEMYHVLPSTINRIVNNKSWKHLLKDSNIASTKLVNKVRDAHYKKYSKYLNDISKE